jgi:hypothetical protein
MEANKKTGPWLAPRGTLFDIFYYFLFFNRYIFGYGIA